MGRALLRIVICDGSPVYRAELAAFLQHDPMLRVEASVGSADELERALPQVRADMIIVDLDARGMDDGHAIERIMRERPVPILVLSADGAEGSERVGRALAAGALEATAKSSIRLSERDDLWATALRSRIKRLGSVRLSRPTRAARVPTRTPRAPIAGRHARVVAIGASTGGPPALARVLSRLPADFRLPVLVVQHMTSGFTPTLVSLLDRKVCLPVRFATPEAEAAPGIWFAPDDAHLELRPELRFALDRTTERGAHRPSLDVLLESVAAVAGEGAVGVVLTGMGRDGANGVAAIRSTGGLTIAQDEASSAVFGMPRAAIDAGAELVLPLDEIGTALAKLPVAGAAA